MNSPLPPSTDFSEIWVQFTLQHTLLFFQELQLQPMIKIQKELQIHAPATAQHTLCSSWWITPSSHIITSKVVALLRTMCKVSWWGPKFSWTLRKRQSKVLDILFFTKSGIKIYARGRKMRCYILTPHWVGYRVKCWGSWKVLPQELLCYLILPERYRKKLKCTSVNRYEDSNPAT